MHIYNATDKEHIRAMIEAFEKCRSPDRRQNVYICYRLDNLYFNGRISGDTRNECKALIRKALGKHPSLDMWLRKRKQPILLCDLPVRYYTREEWLTKIINDLRSYL